MNECVSPTQVRCNRLNTKLVASLAIDNAIWLTGLAPWGFEFLFSGAVQPAQHQTGGLGAHGHCLHLGPPRGQKSSCDGASSHANTYNL
jgi:hypothetical protein